MSGDGQTGRAADDHGQTREKIQSSHHQTNVKTDGGKSQNFLDEYQKDHPVKMDYIHGEETVLQLSMEENSMGFLLPQMRKEELFPTVMADGALPRKTFSMGHAQDKRYYTECRKIR